MEEILHQLRCNINRYKKMKYFTKYHINWCFAKFLIPSTSSVCVWTISKDVKLVTHNGQDPYPFLLPFLWSGVTVLQNWAGPLPSLWTIPLVWFYFKIKNGQDPYPFREPFLWSGLLKNRGGLEGHHVARANEALCDEPGKRTRRVVLGVIVDQLANPLNVLQPFLWSGYTVKQKWAGPLPIS